MNDSEVMVIDWSKVSIEYGSSLKEVSDAYEQILFLKAQFTEVLSELESVKKDNAALIEMNFNLEQQVSALKDDLDQANDQCLEWSDQCHELEDDINELMAALLTIRGITDEHG